MPADIKCPNCGHEFEPNDVIREEVQRELRSKAAEWQKQKTAEFQQELQKKDQEHQVQLQAEKGRLQQQLEANLRRSITADYEVQVKTLQENNRENEEKLKLSRQKELEFLRKEGELKNKEAELEITIQQKLQSEREKLSEDLRKLEEQKSAAREGEYQLRMRELEKQLDDQKKLAEEMRRKAEQGSMQLQGEVQEIALEEMLRSAFPFDLIGEVGKGVRGADCIQTVRNKSGQECGKIIYESKRTENFGGDWIEKLKSDMRSLGADVAIIVTKTMPRGMERFGEKDGVWICSFAELKAVAHMLRDGIIKVSGALRNQVNSGDKMQLLYNYLTSGEFAEQWNAIREGFMGMRISIQKERDAMEKMWKSREKQLDKVLLNAAHVRGSIEGIAGMESIDLNLLDGPDEDDMAH
ncbi:MAG: DUF2130 domain-containing protein [Chitinophagaceae bacterium]|nr:MAG: DUF2130 domain-containing protein [Chitinophagaceae bacterium]